MYTRTHANAAKDPRRPDASVGHNAVEQHPLLNPTYEPQPPGEGDRTPLPDSHNASLQNPPVAGYRLENLAIAPTARLGSQSKLTIAQLQQHGGQPLPNAERGLFEPRFGQDFSQVKIHTDQQSAEMARSVNARAFTVGRDVVFGAGQYQPRSIEGQRLLAHELTHVVQQNRLNQSHPLQRKEEKRGVVPPFDLEVILGPVPKEQEISYGQDKLLALYRYLKEIRRFFPEQEQNVKSLLETYFPGRGEEIWEFSKKPLAGYVGASKGAEATKRQATAEKLGLGRSRKKGWVKKFLGSDVIFFSGHHYARYGAPGMFEGMDVNDMRFIAPRVKLIMISSCAGLADNALKLWRRRFPNAYILGWRPASPLNQQGMMTAFLNQLPEDLILENEDDINQVLRLWKAFVEGLTTVSRSVKPYGLGYASPEGQVSYYIQSKNKWEWVTK